MPKVAELSKSANPSSSRGSDSAKSRPKRKSTSRKPKAKPKAKAKAKRGGKKSPKAKSSNKKKKATTKSPSAKAVEKKHGMDLVNEAERLESLTAEERIAWGLESFPGKIAMSSSFGAQSAISLHMITRQFPDIPVILIDTGYLFPETYQFIRQLTEKLGLNLKIYSNPKSPAFQESEFGKLWEKGKDGIEQYNQMNKVEPMNRALDDLQIDAIFSGIRRNQSSTRKNMPVVVSQRGRVKIHPIIDWTDMEVGQYLVKNDLPYHPLWDEGYLSIGDTHTTRKLSDGLTEEELRFFGEKRECGLHEDVDFQI